MPTKPHNHSSNQSGSALIVALVMMLLVSVLGLSAIKSSVFTTRVATGIQADAMTFETAESAIAATFAQLAGLDSDALYANVFPGYQRCITGDGPVDGLCGADTFYDERSLLKAETLAYFDGYIATEGEQISVTGNSSVLFVDYKVNVLANSEMPTFNIQNDHLQESLKRGLKSGSELE